jgi:hypothetical protein
MNMSLQTTSRNTLLHSAATTDFSATLFGEARTALLHTLGHDSNRFTLSRSFVISQRVSTLITTIVNVLCMMDTLVSDIHEIERGTTEVSINK